MVDDTPPEIKEHLKREAYRDGLFYGVENLVKIYGAHQPALAKERNTTTLAGAKGLTERTLKAYDADVLAAAEGAPTDDARQRFTDDALDLRRALETRAADTETRFADMNRRSALGIKAGALSRQAAAHPEDYPLHAAMLEHLADGASALVKPETGAKFRAIEAEKVARSAVMGFIDQGRFDEGRALLATAVDGGPGALPLPPEAVKELGGVLEERHGQAAAREERLDRVDTVLEGTAGLTEDADEWQALVEEHYQVVAPQMAELDPAERIGAEDDYVRNLGHLPGPLTKRLRAGMLSGEPEHETAAALRLKTFTDHNPALIAAIPDAERARAAAIAEFAELGLKPERAVELGEKKLETQDMLEAAERTGEPTKDGGADGDGDKSRADGGNRNQNLVPRDLNPEDAAKDAELRQSVRDRAGEENEVKRRLRAQVEVGRTVGLDTSADFLERFLDGKGGTVTLDRHQVRQFGSLRDAEETIQRRVIERGFLGKQEGSHEHFEKLKNMKDGANDTLKPDEWIRDFKPKELGVKGEIDLALATGHSKLISKAMAGYKVRRKGNLIHIERTLTHTWEDKYDFNDPKENQGGSKGVVEGRLTAGARALQESGAAKPFDVKANWKQHLKGTIRIENGKLSDPKLQWTDIE